LEKSSIPFPIQINECEFFSSKSRQKVQGGFPSRSLVAAPQYNVKMEASDEQNRKRAIWSKKCKEPGRKEFGLRLKIGNIYPFTHASLQPLLLCFSSENCAVVPCLLFLLVLVCGLCTLGQCALDNVGISISVNGRELGRKFCDSGFGRYRGQFFSQVR